MKFITSREDPVTPARLWKWAGTDESVITVNGKTCAIVIAAGEDLEVTLSAIRRARAVTARNRGNYRRKRLDRLTKKEIDKEIRSHVRGVKYGIASYCH